MTSLKREIAAFLAIPLDEVRVPAIVSHCGFDYMKAHAEQVTPGRGAAWAGAADEPPGGDPETKLDAAIIFAPAGELVIQGRNFMGKIT